MIPSLYNGTIPACSAASIPYPSLPGATVLAIEAHPVTNYTIAVPLGYYMNHPAASVNADFCNITVSYTHPSENDTVHVQLWLPNTYNGRLQSIGGGGFSAGLNSVSFLSMAGSVNEGYATISTDAGIQGIDPNVSPSTWALPSPGHVRTDLLQNLATVSLNDAAIIGKNVTGSFYGQAPAYSYWSGCSQGGRQGLSLAQNYPDAYDGIAASAPAVNWNEVLTGMFRPALYMNERGEFPRNCEINAMTAAAVKKCDGDDGVLDGVITFPEKCDFDPQSLVGTTINCTDTGTNVKISAAAAGVAKVIWKGARTVNDEFIWYGQNQDAALTGALNLGTTACSANGTCAAAPISLTSDWIKVFLFKNLSTDLTKLTHKEYDALFKQATKEYAAIIETSNPDLSKFKASGGKMVTFHGLADQLVPSPGSAHYYDSVTALDPSVQDYYRLFYAPGVGHCFGGVGAYPYSTFDSMRKWVEEGVVPETLPATSLPDVKGETFDRELCAYPKKQYYKGSGNTSVADSFVCK